MAPMIKAILRRCLPQLREEDGNMAILATATIAAMLLVIMPIALNFGIAGTWRRFSQNGSDAAALAGAEEAARELLEIDWKGCQPPETSQMVVERYNMMRVTPTALSQSGAGSALGFSSDNKSELVEYAQFLGPRTVLGGRANNIVHGVVVPPVRVMVKSEATIAGMVNREAAGIDGERVPSYAQAEAYLRRWRYWVTPCPYNKYAVEHHFSFKWEVRLINDPRS